MLRSNNPLKINQIIMNRLNVFLSTTLSLIVLFALAFLVSCDNNDDDGPGQDAQFVGTWNVTGVTIDAMIGDESLAQYLVSQGLANSLPEAEAFVTLFFTGPLQQELTGGSIVLRADKTYTATFDGESENGLWNYNATTQILKIDSDEADIEDVEVKVVSISGNTMVAEQSETEQEDINDDGTPENIEVTIQLTFTKA
jgi:hypothetical protein